MKMKSLMLNGDKRIETAADNMPAMRQGERGGGVRTLQIALADLGKLSFMSATFRSGMPDGIFGMETKNAVMEFQRENGLKIDGVAGRKTFVLMDDILLAEQNPITPVPEGQSGRLGNRMQARRLRMMA